MNPQPESFSYPHPESFRDDNRTPTRFVMESGQFQMTPSLSTFVNPFEASFNDMVQHTEGEVADAANGDVSNSSAPGIVQMSTVFANEASVGSDDGIGFADLRDAVDELQTREFDCTKSHKQSYGDPYQSSPQLSHGNEREYQHSVPPQHDITYEQDGTDILNGRLSSPPLSSNISPEPSQPPYKDGQLTPPETPESTAQASTMPVNIDGDPISPIVSITQQVSMENDAAATVAQKQATAPMLNIPTVLTTTHPVTLNNPEFYIDAQVNPFNIAPADSRSSVPTSVPIPTPVVVTSVPTHVSEPPTQPSGCTISGVPTNAASQSDASRSTGVRDNLASADDSRNSPRTATTATSYSGRKRKTSTTAEESPEQKRQKFLEKNRLAAYKCRQNKKAWIKDLETRRDKLQDDNDRLQTLVRDLHQEWFDWRQKILGHHNCECNIIIQYVQRSAQNNFASFNNPCAYRSARSAASPSSSPSPSAEDTSQMHRYANDK